MSINVAFSITRAERRRFKITLSQSEGDDLQTMPLVERKAPPRLALVPRDQLKAAAAVDAQQQQEQVRERQRVRAAVRARIERQRLAERRQTLADELAEAERASESERESEHDDDDKQVSGIANDEDEDEEQTLQQQQMRLGERFLRMMATMARLSRFPLEEQTDTGVAVGNNARLLAASPTALEQIVRRKETVALQRLSPHKPLPGATTASVSPAKGAAAPLIVPGNAATEPLRPHLTFEISMLLPPPMDTRQSSLRSPVRRKQLRLRRRRRKKRARREKRSWQTSHATWVPHASAAYIDGHNARRDAEASTLAAKFAQLQRPSALNSSSSLPLIPSRRYLDAFPVLKHSTSSHLARDAAHSGHEEDAKDASGSSDGSESHSDDDNSGVDDAEPAQAHATTDRDQLARVDNNEPAFGPLSETTPTADGATAASHTHTFTPYRSRHDDDDRVDSTATDALAAAAASRPRPLYHQPAWISPELQTWLVRSGMFQTRQRPAPGPMTLH